jgi:DNA gyrase subunit A
VIFTTAHAYLLFFSNRGKVYRLKAHEIPEKDRTAKGTAIVNLLPLQPDERSRRSSTPATTRPSASCSSPPRRARSRRPSSTSTTRRLRDGLIAINLRDGDELVRVIETNGSDDIFMVSRNGMTIRFDETTCGPWAAPPPACGA